MADRYVFQLQVNNYELDEVIANHEVIQLDDEGKHILVRILSNKPVGKAVSPRLIDGYLSLLKESQSHE